LPESVTLAKKGHFKTSVCSQAQVGYTLTEVNQIFELNTLVVRMSLITVRTVKHFAKSVKPY